MNSIQKNLKRLEQTKNFVDNNKAKGLKEISSKFGGTFMMYSLLCKYNILIKEDGVYRWNSLIPITTTLAQTLTFEMQEYNKKRNLNKSKQRKLEFHPNVQKVEPKHIRSDKKCVKQQNKPKHKGYELSLFWGLVKIKKN